jgi:D-inositol-3-phosphate glycosyltransferase
MKIVIVGPAKPYRGGIAHFSDELARSLRLRGHEVSLETFSRQYPSFLFPGTTQLEGRLDQLPPHTTARIDSLNPFSWWSAARRIRRQGTDLVVFAYWLSYFAPAYRAIASRLSRAGIPVLGLVHNAIPHEKRIGDRTLGRTFLTRCDRLITLSHAVSEDVRSLNVTTPIVEAGHPVYSHFGRGIDRADAREKLGFPPDCPLVLFFGFIRRYKGLDVLIEAMPRLLKTHPGAVLLVAGEFYEDEQKIRNRTMELGISAAVRFDTRYVPDDRVPVYFSAADLVAQPYRSATQSGVAHIAFHFGRPVVVTDVGGLAETVPHDEAGFVVPPEDPAALADTMSRFFSDAELRERVENGASRQHGVFSWHALAEAVEDAAI